MDNNISKQISTDVNGETFFGEQVILENGQLVIYKGRKKYDYNNYGFDEVIVRDAIAVQLLQELIGEQEGAGR